MKHVLSLAAFGAALVLASTVSINAQGGSTSSMSHMGGMTMMKAPMTIKMNEQNGSGENGTAVLHDTKKGLVVTLHLKNAKGPQPVHIHMGSCAKLNPAPKYPLHNVVNGMSVTTVPGLTIGEIIGKTAINAHKSLTDIPTYVSCGDIAK